MAKVQSYTKSGVDAKFNSRSNMTMVHNGGGSPDISAYPDSKTGDIIERSSDGARWRVVASTVSPIAGRVVSVAGKTGLVTLGPGDVGAAPSGHTHTMAQITDLPSVSHALSNNHIVQRTSTGQITVPQIPVSESDAVSKWYVDYSTAATSLFTTNLDEVITPGNYFQSSTTRATLDRNYPVAGRGGIMVVVAGGAHVKQEYTDYQALGVYYRTMYVDVWSPWQSISQTTV